MVQKGGSLAHVSRAESGSQSYIHALHALARTYLDVALAPSSYHVVGLKNAGPDTAGATGA